MRLLLLAHVVQLAYSELMCYVCEYNSTDGFDYNQCVAQGKQFQQLGKPCGVQRCSGSEIACAQYFGGQDSTGNSLVISMGCATGAECSRYLDKHTPRYGTLQDNECNWQWDMGHWIKWCCCTGPLCNDASSQYQYNHYIITIGAFILLLIAQTITNSSIR